MIASRRHIPLTQERLRQLLHYDPATGFFTRVAHPQQPRLIGRAAGGLSGPRGYREISVDGRRYKAHRLAWLYVHGRWPTHLLDHANLCRADNRLDNLREATKGQNEANTGPRRNNTLGLKGVVSAKSGSRWRARITVEGRDHHLGYFETPEAAHAAYAAAAQPHFGQFARAN